MSTDMRRATLFGKRYVWSRVGGRWSLGRVVKREGPSIDELMSLTDISHTLLLPEGTRFCVGPAQDA